MKGELLFVLGSRLLKPHELSLVVIICQLLLCHWNFPRELWILGSTCHPQGYLCTYQFSKGSKYKISADRRGAFCHRTRGSRTQRRIHWHFGKCKCSGGTDVFNYGFLKSKMKILLINHDIDVLLTARKKYNLLSPLQKADSFFVTTRTNKSYLLEIQKRTFSLFLMS